ncbi:hypothetical protein SEA_REDWATTLEHOG_135 [Gordonia phage RedWattleHog]|uniref:Uncharacterized protein n=1 Tax=Gordonia phage Stormageddon TaxID=2656541 RepID=A0A649VTV3_9CAUD|nr:hypothetical protein KHQ86_gp167 [Gordonia phage Stormageddon]QGJ94993.1 hypothetical protein SEA_STORMAGEDDON_133 [Gordonia phage Stormageddon]QLF83638.1 hypothetical protein SEA_REDWATTLEHOG_135 [Gordonia phage RedWattleHog]
MCIFSGVRAAGRSSTRRTNTMSDMTVGELIELLQQYDEDATVRLATQPNYPLEYRLAGVADAGQVAEVQGDEPDDDTPNVVYLAEGSQVGYASKAIWDAAGW